MHISLAAYRPVNPERCALHNYNTVNTWYRLLGIGKPDENLQMSIIQKLTCRCTELRHAGQPPLQKGRGTVPLCTV